MTKRKNLAVHYGNHGTNPSARKNTEGKLRALRTKELERTQIERAHAKKQRKIQQHLEQTKSTFEQRISFLKNKIKQDVALKRVSRRTAAAQTLAIDKWVSEMLAKKIRETKDPKEAKALEGIQSWLKVLNERQEMELMDKLLGKNPTIELQKDIIAQVNKWKNRVPRMLEGKY
jgi:hypothetical protein